MTPLPHGLPAVAGAAFAAAVLQAAGQAPPVLLFRDGHRLAGRPCPGPAATALPWRHPDAGAPVSYRLDALRGVRLARAVAPNPELSIVELRNGDVLHGRIEALDGERLLLDTAVAGRVAVPRDAVASIEPASAPDLLLYAGPSEEDRWFEEAFPAKSGYVPWTLMEGRLVASRGQTMGAEDTPPLPPALRLDFDLRQTPARRPRLIVRLCNLTAKLGSFSAERSPGWVLRLGRGEVAVSRFLDRVQGVSVGQVPTKERLNGSAHRIAACLDLDSGRAVVAVDGEILGDWRTAGDAADPAEYDRLIFHAMGPISIGRVRLRTWDGVTLPGGPPPGADGSVRAEFLDRPPLAAATVAIRGGVCRFASGSGRADVEHPLDRVLRLRFAAAEATPPGAAAARFLSRRVDRLTGRLLRVGKETLAVMTTYGGEVELRLDELAAIDFQPPPRTGKAGAEAPPRGADAGGVASVPVRLRPPVTVRTAWRRRLDEEREAPRRPARGTSRQEAPPHGVVTLEPAPAYTRGRS